jgi:hypothetical protein
MDAFRSLIAPSKPTRATVKAHLVDQLGRPVDIPDREIAPFASLERTGSSRTPARAPSRVTSVMHSATVTRTRDLFVACSLQPQLELVWTVQPSEFGNDEIFLAAIRLRGASAFQQSLA